MDDLDNKPTFHFKYITDLDIQKETENLISKITEDKISEYEFKGDILYNTGGHGHDFYRGFYSEYITKNGLRATQYSLNRWIIGNDEYYYEDDRFIIIEKQKLYPIDLETFSFPVIKNVNARTISDELQSVKPK